MSTALQQVAERLHISQSELQSIVINTVMPNGGKQVSNDQFISFMAVANEYKLNPLVKEIYAFPAKGGGIQPIVSIDGWLKIINTHKDFDGMVHEDVRDNDGNVTAITCSIYKKNTAHPVVITEYMNECRGVSDPWRKWPIRLLRHKSTIQCGRYAFGISGIIDPDEADRFRESGAIVEEKDITPNKEPDYYSDKDFELNFPKWEKLILSGKKTADDVINTVSAKSQLTDEQIAAILSKSPEDTKTNENS